MAGKKLRLRRWQVSLRKLLFLGFVASVALGCFSIALRSAKQQQHAVEKICAAKGTVMYAHEYDEKQVKAFLPGVLLEWFGRDFWYDAVLVSTGERSAFAQEDDFILYIESLPQLRSIELAGEYTDAGLACLRQHRQLEELSLTPSSEFTGAGLLFLQDKEKLKSLQLYCSSPLSEIGMQRLSRLTSLQELIVAVPDNDAVEYLTDLVALRSLELSGSPISGESLIYIGELSELEALNLDGTIVTGDGLNALTELKKLQILSLDQTPINDADVKRLSQLSALQKVSLWKTNVTDEGIPDLFLIQTLRHVKLPSQISPAKRSELSRLFPDVDIR